MTSRKKPTMEEMIHELIELWTGKTYNELKRIIDTTPKGSDWRESILDVGKDHMLKISKQMTDSAVGGVLYDLRTFLYMASKFSDLAYEQLEFRKIKNELEKQ